MTSPPLRSTCEFDSTESHDCEVLACNLESFWSSRDRVFYEVFVEQRSYGVLRRFKKNPIRANILVLDGKLGCKGHVVMTVHHGQMTVHVVTKRVVVERELDLHCAVLPSLRLRSTRLARP